MKNAGIVCRNSQTNPETEMETQKPTVAKQYEKEGSWRTHEGLR